MLQRFLVGASASALVIALAGPAFAQDRKPEIDRSHMVEELVVTAQKREERLQDVPVSVAAVSGETLLQQGINNPVDLQYVVPGLTFRNSANVRGSGFSIRGVGTAAFSDAIEQSVGTVVDGVAYVRTGQAVADLVDIERVEVLRGPQGFLFGKNASAGVLSITTKRPTFTRQFEALASYATHDEIKLNLLGNLPLSDTLALRLAYSQTTSDGIVENIFRHQDLNGRDSKAVRGKLLWQPTDKASVYIIGDWGRTNTDCCTWTFRSAPAGTILGTQNAAAGIKPGVSNLQIAADQPFFQNGKNYGASVEINYDFGWANLTSVTAQRDWKTDDNNDPDLLPINFLQVNRGRSHLIQKSQEFRLTSPAGGTFDWLVGAYFGDADTKSQADQHGQLNLGLPAGVYLGQVTDSTVDNESTGIFGQASYKLTEKLKVVLGARYTDEVLKLNQSSHAAPGAAGPYAALAATKGRVETTNLSERLTVQYQFEPDVMAYVSAARGFKGPGLNTLGAAAGQATIIRPEIPTSYEAGVRSRFLDGRATVNVTAFSSTYDHYQAQVFDQTLTPATFRITSAGKLKTRGVEFDATVRPAPDTLFNLSGAYIDSEYADFKNISCYLGQPILPAGTPRTSPRQCIIITGTQATTEGDGLPLAGQPKFTYNIGLQQTWRAGDIRIDGRLSWAWRSKTSFAPNGDPGTVQGAYGLLGANLSVGPEQGPWKATVFARNLLDKRFAAYVFPSPVLGATGVYAQFPSAEAQRIVGAMIELKY